MSGKEFTLYITDKATVNDIYELNDYLRDAGYHTDANLSEGRINVSVSGGGE